MTREERLELLKQIEKDIYVCSIESTFLDDAKSCAIHSAIEELEQEPCEDCISREKAKQILYERLNRLNGDELYDIFSRIIDDMYNELQPVTPQQKTGYWILADEQNKEDVENDNYRFICSECQCSDIHAKDVIVPYCWKCGAKMESEE